MTDRIVNDCRGDNNISSIMFYNVKFENYFKLENIILG